MPRSSIVHISWSWYAYSIFGFFLINNVNTVITLFIGIISYNNGYIQIFLTYIHFYTIALLETNSTPPIIYNPVITTKSSTNILGLVVFSIFMGIILGKMGPDAKPLRDVFRSLNIVIMKLVTLVIWYVARSAHCSA